MSATPENLLVAVASKDNSKIDLHFGHAEAFHIYRFDAGGTPEHVELRTLEAYCPEGVTDDNRRDVILKAIADCAALFVARAGEGPTKRLNAAGIEAVTCYANAAVNESLGDWFRARAA